MHGNYQVWTEARVEELIERWVGGDSAKIIGQAMQMSPNAILGKVHRLGLASRKSEISFEAKPQRRVFAPRSLKRPKPIATYRGEPRSHLTGAFISSFKKRPPAPELTKTELRAQLTLAVLNTGRAK